MKKREPVSKIMSTNLKTVNLTNDLNDVKAIFNEHKVRHIPVVSGNKLIGLISLTDFMRITYNVGEVKDQINQAIFSTLGIKDVMTTDLITVSPNDTIRDVAEILANKEFHALPVVEGDELKGIVSTTDIIKYLLEQY
ncbi:MAG: membrane protein [Candidatus Sericytochromatia bacterium]|nr:MAG: membrane protein [Candidatus Sericytochromatia bacterium]